MIWARDPVAFEIYNLEVFYYGLFAFAGGLISYFGVEFIQKKFRQIHFSIDSFIIGALFFGILGARIFDTVFYNWNSFMGDPSSLFDFSRKGLSSHGLLTFVTIFSYFFSKYNKVPFSEFLDTLSAPAAMMASMIRLGNFFNSEILGTPTSFILGIKFIRVDMVMRHPVQLYEFFLLFLLSLFLLWGIHVKKWLFRSGLCSAYWLTIYFGGRFFLEFFKEKLVPAAEAFMNMGQYLSLPLFIFGIFLLLSKFRSSHAK